MLNLARSLVIALVCASLPVIAAENPQHERMRNCNKTAKTKALKGDERKTFMKTCLSTKKDSTGAAPTTKAAPAAKAKAKAS
jgi:hypothetical protein